LLFFFTTSIIAAAAVQPLFNPLAIANGLGKVLNTSDIKDAELVYVFLYLPLPIV